MPVFVEGPRFFKRGPVLFFMKIFPERGAAGHSRGRLGSLIILPFFS